MKSKLYCIVIVIFVACIFINDAKGQSMYFVKEELNSTDIYVMPDVDVPAVITQLTTHPAIDNHPSTSNGKMVWSSNRMGNFDLYYADLSNVEGTAVQITSGIYSERHPHLSHDGLWIVYTAKYRFEPSVICPKSECSIPVNEPCGWYEGLRIIQVGTWTVFDLELTSMSITGGGIWPATNDNWVGHPSFSPDGSQILFSAALDEGGTDWETYVVDFIAPDSLANLRRVTQGTVYPVTPNPIPMSAGAHFSHMGDMIFYGSTRTPLGNSQIFVVPAGSVNAPVHPMNQLTWNAGNDYVPEPLMDSRVVITSDLGLNPSCPPPDTSATLDLDLFIINDDGSNRINLTDNDTANEMYLIGDEVSWFCGLKPNLSECTFMPKAWNICFFYEFFKLANYPNYLPNFPKKQYYMRAWPMLAQYMMEKDPFYWNLLMQEMNMHQGDCETLGWLAVQSYWLIPSLFDERWDLDVPRPPALIAPFNRTIVNVPNILFEWTPLPEALTYGISIATDPGFTNEMFGMSNLPVPQFMINLSSGSYFWRASATNSNGDETWSTVWMLDVDLPIVTAIWTGLADNDWGNPNNWSTFQIPDSQTDVLIPDGMNIYPSIGIPAVCRNFTIESGVPMRRYTKINER